MRKRGRAEIKAHLIPWASHKAADPPGKQPHPESSALFAQMPKKSGGPQGLLRTRGQCRLQKAWLRVAHRRTHGSECFTVPRTTPLRKGRGRHDPPCSAEKLRRGRGRRVTHRGHPEHRERGGGDGTGRIACSSLGASREGGLPGPQAGARSAHRGSAPRPRARPCSHSAATPAGKASVQLGALDLLTHVPAAGTTDERRTGQAATSQGTSARVTNPKWKTGRGRTCLDTRTDTASQYTDPEVWSQTENCGMRERGIGCALTQRHTSVTRRPPEPLALRFCSLSPSHVLPTILCAAPFSSQVTRSETPSGAARALPGPPAPAPGALCLAPPDRCGPERRSSHACRLAHRPAS